MGNSKAPLTHDLLDANKVKAFELNRLHFRSEEHQLRASLEQKIPLPSPHYWIEQDQLPEVKPDQYALSSRMQVGVLANDATVTLIANHQQDEHWHNVKTLVSSWSTFAALTHDQRVITQPHDDMSHETEYELQHRQDVVDLVANIGAFAALTRNGDLLTWGNPQNGGVLSRYHWPTSKVIRLFNNHLAFGALTENREFISWGDFLGGGDENPIANAAQIASTSMAFAVLQASGRIQILGDLAIKEHFETQVRPYLSDPIFVIGNNAYITIGTARGELWVIGRRHHRHHQLPYPLHSDLIQSVISSREAFALTLTNGQSWIWDQQRLHLHPNTAPYKPILMAEKIHFLSAETY